MQKHAPSKSERGHNCARCMAMHDRKIDYDRIEFMLKLCEAYQGHTKTKRTLLKTLHKKGINITNVPINVALPII